MILASSLKSTQGAAVATRPCDGFAAGSKRTAAAGARSAAAAGRETD
jgi:hypothetical protein